MRVTAAFLLVLAVGACSPRESVPGLTDDTSAIDTEARSYDLRGLETRLQQMPPGIAHDYAAGMLAVRSGRYDEGVRLLNKAIPTLRDAQPASAAIALDALADAYNLSYRYRDAAQTYDKLEQQFANYLPRDIADDAALARLVREIPAQTIAWNEPVRLPAAKNPIKSVVAILDANGVREQWLLDTGANQSVVTKSFAARLGITPLPGTAMVGSGLTGLKSPMQVGVVPELRIGGATVRNVIVLILDDKNLLIGSGPDVAYQIHAILGFPVLKALGTITITSAGEFLATAQARSERGAPIFMRSLTPVIECVVDGEPLLFTFDTGASGTGLSPRYYERFRQARESSWRTRTVQIGGAGGSITQTVFIQPAVTMKVADTPVTLENVSISSSRVNADIDILYGNIGNDFVEDFESFTLDLVSMRFSLGRALDGTQPAR